MAAGNRTVHFSSIREILTSQELETKVSRYTEGGLTHIEYLHQVPAGTPQDPLAQEAGPCNRRRHCHQRRRGPMGPGSNPDPHDGASPVDPGPGLLDIYTAMVIGYRAQDRDLSDEQALERCNQDVRTAITYVLGRIEATGASLDEDTKHRLTMAQLQEMPVEMLDRAYNLHRLEHHGINLDDHPQYRS